MHNLAVNRIKALCFDVDGTLSDTDDMWVNRAATLFKPLHCVIPQPVISRLARRTIMVLESPGNFVYNLLDRLHLDDELAAVFNWMAKRAIGKKPTHFLLISGIREMLDILSTSYPMAVVSARDERSTRAFLQQFGLERYFKIIITAQTCLYTKPYPHPIVKAAEIMGVEPHEIAMIGDTTVDIKAGLAAGSQTIGVLCGFGTVSELQRAGANLIVDSTAEVISYLMAG